MEEFEPHARLHVILRGLVQGVGFRFYALELARRSALTGWVRNNRDGSVEAVAEGTRQSLQHWLAALRQGPRGARVTEVETDWGSASGEYSGFTVRHA